MVPFIISLIGDSSFLCHFPQPSWLLFFRQYRTKIVRQMRRQIFRQMKQKAEWILDVFTSIFVKYESLFRIWRMQIASSDFLRDEGKNGENPLWIFEYFPEISRKICTQDACEKIRNRLWREICKQMACKVDKRSLCGIAFILYQKMHLFASISAYFLHSLHKSWFSTICIPKNCSVCQRKRTALRQSPFSAFLFCLIRQHNIPASQ